MIALLTIAAAFALFHMLVLCASYALGVEYWLLVAFYYIYSEMADRYGLQHAPWLRRSRFSSFVGRRLFRTKFVLQQEVWDQIRQTKEPKVFVCGPHGIACSHLVFGFAAYGDQWPDAIGAHTYVVAHWIYLVIPIVRNIYAAYGVVDSRQRTIEAVLERGDNIAICACGLIGKCHAVSGYRVVIDSATKEYKYIVPTPDGKGAFESGAPAVAHEEPELFPVVLQRSTQRLGIFKLAAQYGATVFPVLSPHEDESYFIAAPWMRQRVPDSLVVLVIAITPLYGYWLVLQVRETIEWYVGNGVKYAGALPATRDSVERFADAVYEEFSDLASENLYGVVFDYDHTTRTKRSRLSTGKIKK